MTGTTPPAAQAQAGEHAAAVSEAAVAAALAAVPGYQRQAREAVWLYPSQGQARVMLEAAAPIIAAAEAERIAAHMDALAAASGGSSHCAYLNAAREIREGRHA